MKKSIKNPVKIGLLMASFMLVCGMSSGTIYTASASGNWSSAVTWGGSAPPFTLPVGDIVIVPLTYTVTMDQNVAVDGTVNVLGTLSASPYVVLNVNSSGSVIGAGSINAAEFILNTGSTFTFTGAVTADTIINSMASLGTSAQMTFYNELNLSGLLTMDAAGVLTAGTNSNITIAGGSIVLAGGTLALTSPYSVNYITASAIAGLELTGTGLGVVTINVPSADTVVLGSNVVMDDSLKFASGILKLDGFNLTTSSQITGQVAIAGNVLSSLTVNTAIGLSNAIGFVKGFQNLENLTVNVGAGNSVTISSGLMLNGNLVISSGSELNISNEALTIMGDLTGTGSIAVNSLSKLAFTGINSITGNLFLSGIAMGKFTENIGATHTLTLATALNVDTLDLASGILVLNGNNLSVNADISALGVGTVFSTHASSISVNTLAAVTDSLMFSPLGDTIKNLTMNVGNAGSLKLGSDLVIDGALNFAHGYLDIGSSNLTMASTGSVTGAGNTSYIITSNGGYLTMNDTIGKTITYEVGTLANYLPATLNLNPGSAIGTVGLSAMPVVYSQGTSGVVISAYQPMVDATWLFQNNIGAGINADMELSWSAGAEVNGFLHTDYDYISHYSSMWDDIGDSMIAIVSGSMYSVVRANVTSMSPFAVFNQQTIPTSVSEVTEATGNILIYPNPVTGNLNIQNNTGSTGLLNGEIYNTLGQVVSTFQFQSAATIVPVSGLADGVYFLRLYNDNMQVVRKFSKI